MFCVRRHHSSTSFDKGDYRETVDTMTATFKEDNSFITTIKKNPTINEQLADYFISTSI